MKHSVGDLVRAFEALAFFDVDADADADARYGDDPVAGMGQRYVDLTGIACPHRAEQSDLGSAVRAAAIRTIAVDAH